jgi:hypothetical protein
MEQSIIALGTNETMTKEQKKIKIGIIESALKLFNGFVKIVKK